MPGFPIPVLQRLDDKEEGPTYTVPINLDDYHLVYRYSGISIDKLFEYDCYEYRILLLNSIVHEMKKTEEGRNDLHDYYLYSQHNTALDKEGLLSIL